LKPDRDNPDPKQGGGVPGNSAKRALRGLQVLGYAAVMLVSGCAHRFEFPSLIEDFGISGEFQVPSGDGPFPAVVLLPPCSGVGPFMRDWARGFVAAGYAALVVDSLATRMTFNVCEGGSPRVEEVSIDAISALRYLHGDARIDRQRLAVMGWSHGASAALEINSLADFYALSGVRAIVAVYPGCETLDPHTRIATLLVLAGSDDWTPPRACVRVAERLADAALPGASLLRMTMYPQATHSFDQPGSTGTYLGHRIAYDPVAASDAREQVGRFLAEQFGANPRFRRGF
jgi:dienelactone hydrolase